MGNGIASGRAQGNAHELHGFRVAGARPLCVESLNQEPKSSGGRAWAASRASNWARPRATSSEHGGYDRGNGPEQHASQSVRNAQAGGASPAGPRPMESPFLVSVGAMTGLSPAPCSRPHERGWCVPSAASGDRQAAPSSPPVILTARHFLPFPACHSDSAAPAAPGRGDATGSPSRPHRRRLPAPSFLRMAPSPTPA